MVIYGVRVGDALIAQFPDLDLSRRCDECLQLRVALNAIRPGDESRVLDLSRRIVHNANRHALRKFGTTRAEQQAAIAAAIARLIGTDESAQGRN